MNKIAVIIHDAGAATVLLSLIKTNFNKAIWYIFTPLDSPAYKIANEKNINIQKSNTIEVSINLIFYGTTWQNDFHIKFIKYAKKRNIKTIAFLDNWENYKKRFNNIFPDFICVNDELAYETAKNEGLKNLIKVKDYATLELLRKAENKNITQKNTLLILSEPTSSVAKNSFGDENYWGFTEDIWIKNILDNFKYFSCDFVTIRLHPSDKALKYENIMKSYKYINYKIEQKTELLDDLLSSKIVIGINTIALYYAYLFEKLSISYIPSKNRTCNLPIAKRNQIQSFKDFNIFNFKYNDANTVNNFGIDFETLLERLS